MRPAHDRNWASLVDPAAAEKAVRVAGAVGARLADPGGVRATVCAPRNRGLLSGRPPWSPLSLGSGYPAMVLLYGELDRQFPDLGWDEIGRAHVVAMGNELEASGLASASLFGGATGIAMALRSVSRDGERYARLAAKVDQAVLRLGERLLGEAASLQGGTTMSAYDLIDGVSGLCRYLLLQPERQDSRAVLRTALEYLVSLAKPVEVGGRLLPGWYVPAERQYTEADMRAFPLGNFNCGLAHGIPGPLATLAIAHGSGVRIPAQEDAMRVFAAWLMAQRRSDEFGPLWPSRVPLEMWGSGEVPRPESRASWCYGAAGASRALHLAGQALGDASICDVAVESVIGLFRRGRQSWDLESTTLCHGLSGLLQLTLRMAFDTGNRELAANAAELAADIATRFDPAAPFGFRDIERSGDSFVELDKAGLLEGAAGVALALSSVGANRQPLWDYAMGLA